MPRSELFDGLVSGPRDSLETKAITWPTLGLGTGTGEGRTSPELCCCSLGSDLGVSPFTFLDSTFHLTEFSKRATSKEYYWEKNYRNQAKQSYGFLECWRGLEQPCWPVLFLTVEGTEGQGGRVTTLRPWIS